MGGIRAFSPFYDKLWKSHLHANKVKVIRKGAMSSELRPREDWRILFQKEWSNERTLCEKFLLEAHALKTAVVKASGRSAFQLTVVTEVEWPAISDTSMLSGIAWPSLAHAAMWSTCPGVLSQEESSQPRDNRPAACSPNWWMSLSVWCLQI